MTDPLTTLTPFLAILLVVVGIGAAAARSETARAWSDRYDEWDWRS